jgi:hypothetical protein
MDRIKPVPIKMSCPICQSEQTFLMTNNFHENCEYSNYPPQGVAFRAVYNCTHCQKFTRHFFIKISEDKTYMMKVGQFPAWEISSEPNMERLLGGQSNYYKKGLICESQGYGIAAFSYYRRIVEEIIDELLNEISELMSGEELEKYNIALEETKKTIVAQEKIALVKDILPPILRPDGMNPLSLLHSILSEGLHAGSEEECLENAMAVREVLVFLVNQVAASKAASKGFSENMRKLLERKNKKTS